MSMTPFDLAHARVYCNCGGFLEADTQDPDLAAGLVEVFHAAHSGDGHGKAGPEAPRLVHARREREWQELWTG